MLKPRLQVLFVASHPVQYGAPVFRRLASCPEVDIHVAYCNLDGAEAAYDAEFGATVKWDVPLLDGYLWSHIPNRGSGKESFFGLRNPGLWSLIRNGGFDAVISHVGYVRSSFWIAYFAARFSRATFLFGTDATSLAPRDARAWKVGVKKILWPHLFSLADQVMAPSTAGRDFMLSLGLPEDRVTLTPFPADNDWWLAQSEKVDRAAVRASWGVSSNQLVVLFCGKLQPWKRPFDLLRAFAKAGVPDSVLAFAGEGPQRKQLELEASALGIGDRVRFLGFVNQSGLPSVYTSADLFVLPSDYDPCPVVVCEAMLCGCPAVLSDQIRGRFDLVRPGLTGDIYPVGDTDTLANILQELLSSPSQLALLSRNARERLNTWSPRESVAGIVEAIAVAVSRRHAEKPAP
jgi:glycosyltransferase involved in cell wall biosynthesis